MSVLGTAMNLCRTLGELAGYQLVVELSEHSIEIELERPDKDKRAWDTSLYKSGNVFLEGYANPIKPGVEAKDELENHDSVTVEEGGDGLDTDKHVSVIASSRFKTYMKQDLISQLLTPNEQWKLLAYAVGGLALVMLINVMLTASAAGVF